MTCCDYCLYRAFGRNPDGIENDNGYLLAHDRVEYKQESSDARRKPDAIKEGSDTLPYAIKVTHKAVALRRDPTYPGTKLRYVVPVGSFLKPLEKATFQHEGVKITFFRVQFNPSDNPESLVSGWLLDYSPGAKEYVLCAVGKYEMSTMERGALVRATAVSNVPRGKWYRGNPDPGCLPDKIKVIGKTLAVRKSPEYPGKKLPCGFDVGDILKPLEQKIVTYKSPRAKFYVTSNENSVINFYRVEFNDGQEGWLLDYSPGNDQRTLEIFYQ